MATYKNDIILIAGSGDFAFEAANFLTKKEKLNHIILLSNNSVISKRYKKLVSYFDIRDIEKIIRFIKKRLITKVLIIGYVHLPPIKEIKLSLSSKLILSKNFFLNDINNQSKILKNFVESKNLKILSQKMIFDKFLINYSDHKLRNEHKNIYKSILKNTQQTYTTKEFATKEIGFLKQTLIIHHFLNFGMLIKGNLKFNYLKLNN